MQPIAIFEWCAWERFLITHVAPEAKRIPAIPGRSLRDIDPGGGPAMVHINLSRPCLAFPDYSEWVEERGASSSRVLNSGFKSIDKWAIQESCKSAGLPQTRAERVGDPAELLVVKARANHYGRYERSLPTDLVGDMKPPPWPYPERVHKFARRDVPDALWNDPRITVERFIGNSRGLFQRSYVIGDYVAVATARRPGLVKEMDHRLGVELISTDDASVLPIDPRDPIAISHRLAREMHVDFAALDLAVDDCGTVYPIDLNTTPVWGAETDLNPRLIAELRQAFARLVTAVHGSRQPRP